MTLHPLTMAIHQTRDVVKGKGGHLESEPARLWQ